MEVHTEFEILYYVIGLLYLIFDLEIILFYPPYQVQGTQVRCIAAIIYSRVGPLMLSGVLLYLIISGLPLGFQ
jgi:NADH:ubiquinone oxidoreductase subunit 3 (subunit A)